MGTFFTPVEIAGPDQERFETVDALVDTGASYSMMPASLLRSLGVSPFEGQEFRLANGEMIHREIGEANVRIDGRVTTTPVVFSDERSHSILGAMTLEQFSLAVDPVDMRLVPTSAIEIQA